MKQNELGEQRKYIEKWWWNKQIMWKGVDFSCLRGLPTFMGGGGGVGIFE